MDAKICGVKDPKTLEYIINHKYPPKFIGFIANYPKSKRYLEFNQLKEILNIDKKVSPDRTKKIKELFNIKIITALTIEDINDVLIYKQYEKISDIILFDSKGYEKSVGFNHELLNEVPASINKMLAGNIKYNDKLDKYIKITDIIDISGSLETTGEKDISKINIFLNNIKKLNDET